MVTSERISSPLMIAVSVRGEGKIIVSRPLPARRVPLYILRGASKVCTPASRIIHLPVFLLEFIASCIDSPGFRWILLAGSCFDLPFKAPIIVGFRKLSDPVKIEGCVETLEIGAFTAVRKPTDDLERVCSFIAFSVYGNITPLTFL